MKNIILTAIVLFSILAIGCAQEAVTEEAAAEAAAKEVAEEETGDEDVSIGKNILMIIAPLNFRDEELFEPKEIFEASDAEVTIASKDTRSATGALGAAVDVDIDISEVDAADYDAIVFIGGPGSSIYFNDPVAHKIARDAAANDKVLGAICIAPSTLANAGVLQGKKVTASSSEINNVKAKSAGYTGEDVTIDGKIVTADGPGASKKFGEEIMRLLG